MPPSPPAARPDSPMPPTDAHEARTQQPRQQAQRALEVGTARAASTSAALLRRLHLKRRLLQQSHRLLQQLGQEAEPKPASGPGAGWTGPALVGLDGQPMPANAAAARNAQPAPPSPMGLPDSLGVTREMDASGRIVITMREAAGVAGDIALLPQGPRPLSYALAKSAPRMEGADGAWSLSAMVQLQQWPLEGAQLDTVALVVSHAAPAARRLTRHLGQCDVRALDVSSRASGASISGTARADVAQLTLRLHGAPLAEVDALLTRDGIGWQRRPRQGALRYRGGPAAGPLAAVQVELSAASGATMAKLTGPSAAALVLARDRLAQGLRLPEHGVETVGENEAYFAEELLRAVRGDLSVIMAADAKGAATAEEAGSADADRRGKRNAAAAGAFTFAAALAHEKRPRPLGAP